MSHRSCLAGSVLLALVAVALHSQSLTAWKDPSPHAARFVAVDRDVQLEVLDWGGSGRPIVLLAGGGNTAHVFDNFAPKLTLHGHVYGITRRGFGASGYSPTDRPADRLGDDVVAVLDALDLKEPVLVGHSIAGVELSSVANNRPNRVAGLVYMDAAYLYALDNGTGASIMEIQKLQGPQPPPPGKTDLASFSALQRYYERMNGFLFPEAELRAQRESAPDGGVGKQRDLPGTALFMPLMTGTKKYTAIPVPALVIFANPHSQGIWVDENRDPSVQSAARTYSTALVALTERQEKSVENGVPTAHVITLPGANHYVFLSNEAEVLKGIDTFLASLH
jgi:pimeloyl-ACP methyl ester carboxylesterase